MDKGSTRISEHKWRPSIDERALTPVGGDLLRASGCQRTRHQQVSDFFPFESYPPADSLQSGHSFSSFSDSMRNRLWAVPFPSRCVLVFYLRSGARQVFCQQIHNKFLTALEQDWKNKRSRSASVNLGEGFVCLAG